MKLGHVVQTIRVECDLSLREVAAAASISAVDLGRIERNVARPKLSQLMNLFDVMAELVEVRERPKRLAAAAKFITDLSQSSAEALTHQAPAEHKGGGGD